MHTQQGATMKSATMMDAARAASINKTLKVDAVGMEATDTNNSRSMHSSPPDYSVYGEPNSGNYVLNYNYEREIEVVEEVEKGGERVCDRQLVRTSFRLSS